MELWLPADNWNGKFLAVGNGGWAGTISFDAMAERTAARLRHGLQRHRSQGRQRGVRRRSSREARRLRLSRDARDGGAVEGHHPGVLQAWSAALVLPGLLDRRPSGHDGSTALSGGLRRDHRRRSGLQHGAPQRVAGRAAGGHAEEPSRLAAAREEDAVRECRHRRVRPARRREGRDHQRTAHVQVRSGGAGVQGWRRTGLPDSRAGREREKRVGSGDDEERRSSSIRDVRQASSPAGAFRRRERR